MPPPKNACATATRARLILKFRAGGPLFKVISPSGELIAVARATSRVTAIVERIFNPRLIWNATTGVSVEPQNSHRWPLMRPAASPVKVTGRGIPAAPRQQDERKVVLDISRFSLGAGVTPAQGSMKPTAGFVLASLRMTVLPTFTLPPGSVNLVG